MATVRGTVATAVAFPQKSESTFPHQQLDKRKLVFLLFYGFERRLLATVRGTAATAVAFPQKSESTFPHQQLDKRKLVFLLFCGFERRLLATVRGTVATAVAFPQKSESTFPRQKSTGLDRDLSIFTYSLFILLQVFALRFSFALNIMYTSRHLNQRSDTHEIHHQGGL